MQHGVAWLGLVAGRKLWHVAPPHVAKPSDRTCAEGSKIDWELARKERIEHCVLKPGEVIFVPDDWWHATCNLEPYTVGVGAQLWVPHFRPHSLHEDAAVKEYWLTRDPYGQQALVKTVPLPPLPTGAKDYSPPSARPPPGKARPSASAGLSCAPYRRQLGSLSVCPILNGVWTSFLDHSKWGTETQPLQPALARELALEMRKYDEVGMDVWVGEDFDERVLSLLRAHKGLTERDAAPPLYTGDAAPPSQHTAPARAHAHHPRPPSVRLSPAPPVCAAHPAFAPRSFIAI